MRKLMILLVALLLPTAAYAAWPESWIGGNTANREIQLVIPFPGLVVGDYSAQFRCGSAEDCQVTVIGEGSYDLVYCGGTDCADVGVAAANYRATGVTLSEGTQVLDLKRNREYRFRVNTAPTTGSGLIKVTPN